VTPGDGDLFVPGNAPDGGDPFSGPGEREGPDGASGAEGSVSTPEAADRRLTSGSFSSGLSVPDFAACLAMGLEPVALVQGYCVMQWSWYGQGSQYMRAGAPYAGDGGGVYNETYRCPHGWVSAEHRTWGQNFEQPWVEEAWAQGFGSAYSRMLDEARQAGAHGVIGVVDTSHPLADLNVTEFHITGTAVVVRDGPAPFDGEPWTTYLSGQRLGKLFEAGYAPISVAATLSSVRVWAYCLTEYLMEGGSYTWGGNAVTEVDQVIEARMAAYDIARDHVRRQLGDDTLQGVRAEVHRRDLAQGDGVIECRLAGTRVRPFKDFDPLPPPAPTVRLT
jgi:hypothetical protein